MALAKSGDCFVWGSNAYGQLGSRAIPIGAKVERPLQLELDAPVRRISMGLRHSAFITRDSRLFVSGAGTKGQLGLDIREARLSHTFLQGMRFSLLYFKSVFYFRDMLIFSDVQGKLDLTFGETFSFYARQPLSLNACKLKVLQTRLVV
jgi:alpha-tubulin suppressor-like RCC1 family protein